jgi:hypothetical protein
MKERRLPDYVIAAIDERYNEIALKLNELYLEQTKEDNNGHTEVVGHRG